MAQRQPFLERFWSRVQIKGPDECWPWTGSKLPKGYGMFDCGSGRHNRSKQYVHRIAWELHYRKQLPKGKIGRHKCNHTWCANPRHVRPGTYKQNTADMVRAGNHYQMNKTHCKRGHAFDAENTYINPGRGGRGKFRACRICVNWHQQKGKCHAKVY